MKLRIEFGFGIDKDKDQNPIDLDVYQTAIDEIKKKAISLFGGYTLYSSNGGWTNGQGKLVEEAGHTLLVYHPEDMRYIDNLKSMHVECDIQEMVELIKEQLNQEAVHVSQHQTYTRLI